MNFLGDSSSEVWGIRGAALRFLSNRSTVSVRAASNMLTLALNVFGYGNTVGVLGGFSTLRYALDRCGNGGKGAVAASNNARLSGASNVAGNNKTRSS